jgi:hypothetical protein
MTTPDTYPSVTIVAGDIKPVRPTTAEDGAFLRMHDGATYIKITVDVARQWIDVLTTITKEPNA